VMQRTKYQAINFCETMKKSLLITIFSVLISGLAFADHHDTSAHESAHQENAHNESAETAHHNDADTAHEEKGFNAGEMIMHHILDAHQIHIATYENGTKNDESDDIHFSIPLPVIIIDGGVKLFSSSKFYHHPDHDNHIDGGHVYKNGDYFLVYDGGEKIYHTTQWKDTSGNLQHLDSPKIMRDIEGNILNVAPLDLSITKSIAGLLLALLITFLIFTSIAKGYKKNGNSSPKGMAKVFEPLIIFVRDDIAIPSIGAKKATRFMPFLLTVFFFIWIANLMGLVPGFGFNVMGTLGVTLVLAGVVFIISTAVSNKHFWSHTLNPTGVPWPIKYIILVPIEIFGLFIRPSVLMVRLTANITAGHIIILAFTALIFIFGENSVGAGAGVGLGATLFMIFMFFIELLVAFLQAYVFTLLSAMYFGMAVEEAHH
jgi:F-type H+-transporting ATPase subunit a